VPQTQTQGSSVKIPLGLKQKASANEAVATFSEGCFWHAEIVFQSLEGVRDAVSGYAGGTDTDPDYEKVSTGKNGSC
jgi:peptide methionine sulfoxide reductase MsrA